MALAAMGRHLEKAVSDHRRRFLDLHGKDYVVVIILQRAVLLKCNPVLSTCDQIMDAPIASVDGGFAYGIGGLAGQQIRLYNFRGYTL